MSYRTIMSSVGHSRPLQRNMQRIHTKNRKHFIFVPHVGSRQPIYSRLCNCKLMHDGIMHSELFKNPTFSFSFKDYEFAVATIWVQILYRTYVVTHRVTVQGYCGVLSLYGHDLRVHEISGRSLTSTGDKFLTSCVSVSSSGSNRERPGAMMYKCTPPGCNGRRRVLAVELPARLSTLCRQCGDRRRNNKQS